MITLNDFKNNNLKINWKVINIGCLGSEIFKNELSYDDIINFSLEEFDEKNKLILRIIASDRDEYQEIGYLVQELANMEKSEYKLEFEKWKLVYVKKNFPKLNKNIKEEYPKIILPNKISILYFDKKKYGSLKI